MDKPLKVTSRFATSFRKNLSFWSGGTNVAGEFWRGMFLTKLTEIFKAKILVHNGLEPLS